MAGILVRANSGEVSLTAATAKTAIQLLAATNHRIKIKGIGIYFKGTVVTDTPVKFRILRQTSAGTMSTGSSGTHYSKNNDDDAETIQTTTYYAASSEPSAGDVLDFGEVHPQNGMRWFYPPGDEIIVKTAGRIGVELTAAQAQTAVVTIDFEE